MPGGIKGVAVSAVQTTTRQSFGGLCAFLMLISGASPALAGSNKVRITGLSDAAFGMVGNLGADAIRSQSLCLFADTANNRYTVTATGTGGGGAFQLSSGTRTMPFDVAWNDSSGQGTGIQLSPNAPLTGLVATATHQTCNNGPASTASLIIILRSTALSAARAGNYTGVLTLIVGAE